MYNRDITNNNERLTMTIIATTIVTIGTVTAFAGLIGHIVYFNILGK